MEWVNGSTEGACTGMAALMGDWNNRTVTGVKRATEWVSVWIAE